MANIKHLDNEQDKMLARVDQKLDDLILTVNEINGRVKFTNGKVAESKIEIAKMQQKYEGCSARKDKEKGIARGWIQWLVPIGFSVLFNVVSLIIVFAKIGG